MKKAILIICLILLFPVAVLAGNVTVINRINETAASGSCTEVLSLGSSGTDEALCARTASTNEYYAFQFTAGDWGPICKIQLHIQEVGDISAQTWTIQLYNDSSNDPGSKVTNGSCTFSGSGVPANGSPDYYGCTLSTCVQLTNTNSYHVGLNRGGSADSSNYIRWSHYGTGGNAYDENQSADESSWTAQDFDSDGRFKLFEGAACSGN